MDATIIGAGSIGRGFLGQLFAEAHATITFVELDETIVAALDARRGYDIRIVADETTVFHVPVARAVSARHREAAARAVAEADVAATAVGVAALPAVAAIITRAVELRVQEKRAPLNVVVCENVLHSGQYLASLVEEKLPAALRPRLAHAMGFAAAVVSRMVPVPTQAQRKADPLAIAVEPYCILPVDAAAFLGERPSVPGFRYADDIVALEEQKAYTHNAGHSMLAYLGYRAGHTLIWEAVEDRTVRRTVERALDETSRALVQRHGFDADEQRRHVEDLFARYANRGLGDTIARVARDPIRKLRADGRLIGSARLALEYGVKPDGIVDGIVAALRYDNPDDAQAVELQSLIGTKGIRAALRQCSGLGDDDRLTRDVETRYLRTTKGAAT
jgi:mannitol-1-phosphate 5-dehydrogenase